MKKKLYFVKGILSLFFLLAYGCVSSDAEVDDTRCILGLIQQVASEPVRNPPVEVWQWDVDGQTYYYITSDCCDQFNYLYDIDCNIVCAPDGGIMGEGDGNCPEFTGEIVKTLLFEDTRN